MKKELKDFTDQELKDELQTRWDKKNEEEMYTLPQEYYPYKEVDEIVNEDDTHLFTVHVDEGSEGMDILLQVKYKPFEGYDYSDKILKDSIKHYYLSRGMNEGWDAYHENISIEDIAPYGTMFMEIDLRAKEDEK